MLSAVKTSSTGGAALDTYGYRYDAAGNRLGQQLAASGTSTVTSSAYNNLNQLSSSTPSGSQNVCFTGSLNGADTVTVNGAAATVSSSNCFAGIASMTPGTTGTVSVVATDSHGNSRTNHYQTVVPTQPSFSPTFDADGNELSNGAGQSYTWDVKNELVSIVVAGGTSQYTYDAMERPISKTDNGTLTRQWVWDGGARAEERNASNTVTKRFFAQGEQISGTSYYYTRDHLGSIREMTDSTGAIQARYDYDPYGRATQLQGSLTSDFQYAGYYLHPASGLYQTWHRAYDPITSRWLSRDPLGEAGGINLYGYVGNNPLYWVDPFGLSPEGGVIGAEIGSFVGGLGGLIVGGAGGTLVEPGGGTIVGGGFGEAEGAILGGGLGGEIGDWLTGGSTLPGTTIDQPQGPTSCPAAKAPGVPTAADGYTPPKNWSGQKVPSPNGSDYGYPAADGGVWVPTGTGDMAHGGPHWDVQYPGGGYKNMRPRGGFDQ